MVPSAAAGNPPQPAPYDSPPEDSPTQDQSATLIGRKVSALPCSGGHRWRRRYGVWSYKAEDLKLGRRVALKFLPEEMAEDPVALKRFEREARTASSLNHANICTIYEIEEYESEPFIAMELLDGCTLRDRLIALGPGALPLDELLEIALQICDGLQAAHASGIIHRDIKPANIFLTSSSPVKILDFGLAKLLEADDPAERDSYRPTPDSVNPSQDSVPATDDLNLTRTGMHTGNGQLSCLPEQARKRRKLDARTDLFSFGAVLYEMATGQRAFTGDDATTVRDAVLQQMPPPPRGLNQRIPQQLEAVINKALQKRSEQPPVSSIRSRVARRPRAH